MKLMNDESIVSELRKGNTSVLRFCYDPAFRSIEKMILKNGGSAEDAKDIFHDALIILNNNCRKPSFELTSALTTYLYSICRHLWFNQLRKGSLVVDDDILDQLNLELAYQSNDNLLNHLREAINKLGEKCREILFDYYYGKIPYDEIATSLGYSSGQVVRQQKYRCIQKLKKEFSYESA